MNAKTKKVTRVAGWIFGGLLLVLCIAVAGALVWLRTDSGERTVAGIAKDALAGQGLILTMDEFSGPLPSRLLLKNVRLADAEGEWFAAKELEVALSLSDLLRKTATVSLARVDTPQVFRLPKLPPAAPEESVEPEKSAPPGYFNLPVGVKLDSLAVENLEVYAPLLFPEAAETATGSAPLLRVNVHGSASAPAENPLQANVSVSAAVADMPALEKYAQTGPLPVTGFAMTADAEATVGMLIEASLRGTLTPAMGADSYPFGYGIRTQLAGSKAALHAFSLDGAGLTIRAKGGANLETFAARAETELTANGGGAWEQIVAQLTGQNLGGTIRAALQAGLAANKDITASAAVSGEGMRWGTDQLQQILGQTFTVKADASGGEDSAYALTLHTLEAGTISASGAASFGPKDKSISAALKAAVASLSPVAPGVEGAIRTELNASGTLDAPSASFEITGDAVDHPAASVRNLRAAGQLSGTLQAPDAFVKISADTIKAEGAALETLRAEAKLTGTLEAPKFSLAATSTAIRTNAGEFKEFRAGVKGTAALPQSGEKTVQAAADITLGGSPAGPVSLHTDLAAAQAPDGSATARLHGLDLSLAGTDLMADITAALPPSGSAAMPSVTGKASAKITDWKPIAALSGVAISGSKAEVAANFTHDANVQHVHASIAADALSLPDTFAINGLSGTLEARDLANPDITLSLNMGKGEAGPVTWQTGAVAVNAQQGNGTFAAALRTDKTAASAITDAAKTPPAKPAKTERLTAAGSFSLTPLSVTLNRLAARVPESPMGVYLTGPATVAMGDSTTVQGLNLAVVPGKGAITLDAALAGDKADLTATITEFPFRLIREAAGVQTVPDGSLSAEAVIKKAGTAIQGKVDAKAVVLPPGMGTGGSGGADSGQTPPVAFTLASTLDRDADPNFPDLRSGGGVTRLKGSVNVGFERPQTDATSQAAANAPDARIHFNVPLRVTANGVPEPAMKERMGATVAWMGEIAPLWAVLPMQDRNLSGLAQIRADVKGPMENPEYAASAYVANGRFEDHILGVLLTDIAVEAASASSGESKIVMRAEDGMGGYVALEGSLAVPARQQTKGVTESAAPVPHIAARGQINHLQPLHRDDVFLRLSGRLSVDGPLDAMAVAADMEVERGEISIANLAGSVRTLDITDPATEAQKSSSSGPTLDVKVSIPHRFYIRGRGLDSEWEGNLAVSGSAGSPSLTGSLKPVRGSFDLLSRDFKFSEGDITFLGGDRIDPALNLALTYEAPNITAIVRATGRSSKPEIAMESQPSLPQDQIMAEVLFGKEFSKLSRFESLQVANSLRQLANIGGDGLDPLATMRTQLGVDMLRIGSSGGGEGDNRSISGAPGANTMTGATSSSNTGDSETTPTLEAGKYINDAIYVGVEQGTTSDSTGVRVEIELRPNLSLQGKTSTRSSEVGLGWKRDY